MMKTITVENIYDLDNYVCPACFRSTLPGLAIP